MLLQTSQLSSTILELQKQSPTPKQVHLFSTSNNGDDSKIENALVIATYPAFLWLKYKEGGDWWLFTNNTQPEQQWKSIIVSPHNNHLGPGQIIVEW